MKRTNFVRIALAVAMLLLVTACRQEGTQEMLETTEFLRNAGGTVAPKEAGEPAEFVQGFMMDDSKPLDEILTKKYPLEELYDFFGEIPEIEGSGYDEFEYKPDLSIQHVDERFPIECFRTKEYVVYEVSEGGYFYVFLSLDDFQPNTAQNHPSQNANSASVHFTAYLDSSSPRTASDFDSLQIGVSTAEDVAKIDPALQMMFVYSSRTPSFSLLSDGSIMEICYSWDGGFESRSDLIVESMEVYPEGERWCSLEKVFPEDLP
ncbi:MAG: hypothetical protein LBM28_05140 [Oscillospiraceae bacterium]|jgi:hypothetical protein|nr:hypothetical protein [Oscillospiraceae bacterium]